MSPKIDKYSAGISVNRAEQRPQRVVETDDKNPRAGPREIFRYKTHPQFFARANYENGDEQNDEIASKAEKIRELPGATYILRVRRLHSHFRMRPRCSNYKERRFPNRRGDLEIALLWGGGALRRTNRRTRWSSFLHLRLIDLAFAFGVKCVVNDEFALENFVIAQPELAEAPGNPAQPFTSCMWIARMRIGRAHNFAQQNERGIGEFVFFQDRIERNVFAVMAELAIRHVEHNSVVNPCPIGVARKKNKFRLRGDEVFDQPRTSNPVHFNFLARDPFHDLRSDVVAAWFWYAVAAALLFGAHQIFTRLAADRIAEGLGGFVVEATAAHHISVPSQPETVLSDCSEHRRPVRRWVRRDLPPIPPPRCKPTTFPAGDLRRGKVG